MRLHLTMTQYGDLQASLFDDTERVAFMFARFVESTQEAHVAEVWPLHEHDYVRRNASSLELADHVRPQAIRIAHENDYAVVEAHAHNWPGQRTCFSITDLEGLHELGPHMIWRLPGRPYTALVLGQDSFDALQWRPDGTVAAIEALVAEGNYLRPTGLSVIHLATDTLTGRSA